MIRLLLAGSFLISISFLQAQNNQDPEFTRGFLLTGRLNNGLTTGFKAHTPDLYMGGLGLCPQVTVVQHRLRVGANTGIVYNNKRLSAMVGPMLSFKLKTLGTKYMGSYANIQLLAEANWGTHQQHLAGGGIAVEVFKKIHLGITAQREYHLNGWWFQSFIGVNLAKTKEAE